MSSPSYLAPWLARTGGIAAVTGVTPPAQDAAFFDGEWGKPEIISPFASSAYEIAPGVPETDAYDGYLLGWKSLSQKSVT